ncbi:MAG: hypothetical protein POH28_12645 [Acidocella sp.]|nr:hypothetical protein [Acidocella sp.]
MSVNIRHVFPCATFFASGQLLTAVVVLLMQLTVLLWPMASRMAKELDERHGVERLLAQLSETHRAPSDPYAMPMKKFRQLA